MFTLSPTLDFLSESYNHGDMSEKNQGKARSDMTVEERIEAADRRKLEGNDYFKEKKFVEAMQQYEMVSALLL